MDVPAMDVPGFRLSNVYLLGYPEVSMPRSGKYLWPGARRPTIFGEDRRDGRSSVRAGTGRKPLLALELSAFGFFGLFWGCFAVLLADLSGSLGLSPGPLGVALFVGAGASIATMAALGWASDHLGRRAYLILATCAFGAGIVGLGRDHLRLRGLPARPAARGGPRGGNRPQGRPRDHSRGRGRRLRAFLAPAGTIGGGRDRGRLPDDPGQQKAALAAGGIKIRHPALRPKAGCRYRLGASLAPDPGRPVQKQGPGPSHLRGTS
jgi:hypothetical protein